MPGPVVHTIIAEKLPDEFQTDHADIASAADSNRRALVYGAQGPDPFFFNLNDLTGHSIAKYLIEWQDFKSKLANAFYKIRKPFIDASRAIGGAANDAVLEASKHSDVIAQVKNLAAQLSETMFLARKTINGYLKKLVLDTFDPFGLYVSPLQTCGRTKDIVEGVKTPFDGVGGWKDVANLDDWWWFDLLHSRRTGDFATELLDIATGKKPGADGSQSQRNLLMSYAIGYLSHISADVVGHAYVNSVVGGPYRLAQAQRHTVQEKIMDVWAYNRYYNETGFLSSLDSRGDRYYQNPDVVDSGMHKNFQFTAGRLEPRQWERNPENPLNKAPQKPIRSSLKLPNEITTNFTTATDRAYPSERFGSLTPDEVDLSYRGWYTMFRNATTTFSPFKPSELPGDVQITEELREEIQDTKEELEDVVEATENLSEPFEHDGGGDISDCFEGSSVGAVFNSVADCVEEAAESAANFISNLAESVANLFREVGELLWSIVQVVDAALAVPLRVINYFIRQAYEKLWQSYTHMLKLVTAIGFSYMYWDDLDGDHHLEHFYNPTKTDAIGVNTPRDTIVKPGSSSSGFPRYGLRLGQNFQSKYDDVLDGLENEGHLIVPPDSSAIESPATIPGPDEYGRNTPEVFIDDPNDELTDPFGRGQQPPLWSWIASAGKNDETLSSVVADTPNVEDFRISGTGSNSEDFTKPVLGDAVSLTRSLFDQYQETGRVPNLNMSGDRAIGYPTWANKRGCGTTDRDRWKLWHGAEVPWLRSPIDPVFVPKVPKTDWDDESDVPGDVYY